MPEKDARMRPAMAKEPAPSFSKNCKQLIGNKTSFFAQKGNKQKYFSIMSTNQSLVENFHGQLCCFNQGSRKYAHMFIHLRYFLVQIPSKSKSFVYNHR